MITMLASTLRWLTVLLLLAPLAAAAATFPLTLDDGGGRYAIAEHLEYLHEGAEPLSLAEVRSPEHADGFRPTGASTPNFGFNAADTWFRFSLDNRAARQRDWLLEVGYPMLDHLDVYLIGADGSHRLMRGGDRLPFEARALKDRNINFRLDVPPGERREVYIRVSTDSSLQLPLVLWDLPTYVEANAIDRHVTGLYYGLLLGLFVFNLILFLSSRDTPYLYYLLHLLTYALFQATLHGLSYEYLWPDSPNWGNTSLPLFMALGVLGVTEFTRSFLDVRRNFPRLNRVFTLLAVAALATAAAAFVAPYSLTIRLATLEAIVGCAIVIATGSYALAHGIKQARYFMIAWSVFLFGSILYALKAFGVLPAVFVTNYGQQIGSTLELILLSMALADRLRILEAENERIQHQAKIELESRVQERTRDLDAALQELAQANTTLQELSLIDPLTGIRNRKFFIERYAEEWRRAVRGRYPLALVMIDIDHFKAINDRYGHLSGDACIKAVAETLQGALKRPGDQVARYGGEEFCLILPHGEAEGVTALAEDLRRQVQACRPPIAIDAPTLTISAGIAIVRPRPEDDPDSLIAEADAALYEAKRLGRNRVQIATGEPA